MVRRMRMEVMTGVCCDVAMERVGWKEELGERDGGD